MKRSIQHQWIQMSSNFFYSSLFYLQLWLANNVIWRRKGWAKIFGMYTSYFRTGIVNIVKTVFGILLLKMIVRHLNGINDALNMKMFFAHFLVTFCPKHQALDLQSGTRKTKRRSLSHKGIAQKLKEVRKWPRFFFIIVLSRLNIEVRESRE